MYMHWDQRFLWRIFSLSFRWQTILEIRVRFLYIVLWECGKKLCKFQYLAWSVQAGSTPGGRRKELRSETGTGPEISQI